MRFSVSSTLYFNFAKISNKKHNEHVNFLAGEIWVSFNLEY